MSFRCRFGVAATALRSAVRTGAFVPFDAFHEDTKSALENNATLIEEDLLPERLTWVRALVPVAWLHHPQGDLSRDARKHVSGDAEKLDALAAWVVRTRAKANPVTALCDGRILDGWHRVVVARECAIDTIWALVAFRAVN